MLVWVTLLGMIAFTALWNAPAHATLSTAESCGNAPEPGADYLSDPCAWAKLRTWEQGASGHNVGIFAPQDQQQRGERKPAAQYIQSILGFSRRLCS